MHLDVFLNALGKRFGGLKRDRITCPEPDNALSQSLSSPLI